jgi:hypothetical protein
MLKKSTLIIKKAYRDAKKLSSKLKSCVLVNFSQCLIQSTKKKTNLFTFCTPILERAFFCTFFEKKSKHHAFALFFCFCIVFDTFFLFFF